MGKREWTVLSTLAASLLLASIAVAAPASHSLDWWVMGGGTGKATGSIVLDGTLGQAVTGVDGGGDSVVCSGFWYGLGPCGEPAQFPIYLPLVVRSSP